MKINNGPFIFFFLFLFTLVSHSQNTGKFNNNIASTIDVESIEMISNGNGPITNTVGFDITTPPTGYSAYSADWYRDVTQGSGSILNLQSGMQVNGGWYFVVERSGTIDYTSALERWTRIGVLDTILAGNSYEIRFTANNNKAFAAFTNKAFIDVPFEIWYLGATLNDPTDDVRMIPWIYDDDFNDIFSFKLDHQASGGTDDPYSDWIYFIMPVNNTPGQSGYNQFVTAGTNGTYNYEGTEHLARIVLMNWDRHQNETAPGLGDGPVDAMPEIGTIFRLTFSNVITDIDDKPLSNLPEKFNLKQNYPNPFNPSTTIEFSIPRSSQVLLEIYNVIGEKVATLVDQNLPPGNYKQPWSATNIANGVYCYRLKAENYVETRKMLFMK